MGWGGGFDKWKEAETALTTEQRFLASQNQGHMACSSILAWGYTEQLLAQATLQLTDNKTSCQFQHLRQDRGSRKCLQLQLSIQLVCAISRRTTKLHSPNFGDRSSKSHPAQTAQQPTCVPGELRSFHTVSKAA